MSAIPHPTSSTTPASDASHWDVAAAVIVGIQAVAFTVAAVGVFAGVGVGSTVLRIGVGALFLVLGLGAAGIALGLNEGQPSSRTSALVFEGFALALALLWLTPTVL